MPPSCVVFVAVVAVVALVALPAVLALPVMLIAYVPPRFPEGISPLNSMLGFAAVPVMDSGAKAVTDATPALLASTIFRSES